MAVGNELSGPGSPSAKSSVIAPVAPNTVSMSLPRVEGGVTPVAGTPIPVMSMTFPPAPDR